MINSNPLHITDYDWALSTDMSALSWTTGTTEKDGEDSQVRQNSWQSERTDSTSLCHRAIELASPANQIDQNRQDVFTRARNPEEVDSSPSFNPAWNKNPFTQYIIDGNNDKILELINNGHNINASFDCEPAALITAVSYGTLETILLLLKHGADPNDYEITPNGYDGLNIKHVLAQAGSLPKMILLLSYGADPNVDYQRELNVAIYDKRSTHLLVYYHWQQYCIKHPDLIMPDSISELNKLVLELPVLWILAANTLFDSGQISLTSPTEHLPANLKRFFEFIV